MAHSLRLWYSSTRDLTGDIIAQGDTQDRARDSLAVILLCTPVLCPGQRSQLMQRYSRPARRKPVLGRKR